MKKIFTTIIFIVLAFVIYATTIPTNSQFLGNREKGIGVEVTSGGNVKILPKSTVGTTTISGDITFSGDMSTSDATFTFDSTATFQNGLTFANAISKYDSLRNFYASGILVDGTIAVSGAAEEFKTTTTLIHVFDGIQYSKAAEDSISFSSAYTINTGAADGDFWGAFLIQSNSAGTISTKSVSADQVYASEAAAIAALPSADTSNNAIGYITVQANSDTDWVANTDDLTAASDCQDVNFYDATVNSFPDIASP